MKIAVVTPIPTPYRDPFWNELANRPDVDLSVFYCSGGKKDRPWEVDWHLNFHAEVLPGKNLLAWRGQDASCYWNPLITRRLKENKYDALLIGGYNHLTMWAAIRFARRNHIPYFIMCESYDKKHENSGYKKWLKQKLVNYVVGNARAGIPTGKLAAEYLVSYGAKKDDLIFLPNAPDVVSLAKRSNELTAIRSQLRNEYGLGDGVAALFVGRLIPKKRAGLLIRAFHKATQNTDGDLVIVGGGPEEEELKSLTRSLQIEDRVHFQGFVQPSEVSKYYAMADLFILPSSETWGVVVSEALASSLPVIVTDQVGCHPDVINSPSVGDVVIANDEPSLTAAMEHRFSNPTSRESIADAWKPVFETQRYDRLAAKVAAQIRNLIE